MKTIVGITEELTFNQLSKLDSFVLLYNKISHQLYVDLFIKKLPIKDLSPAYQAKYLISKRHFDSIRKLLEGKVSSILALNKSYLQEAKDKIKTIEKDLSKQTKIYTSYKEKYKLNNNQLSPVETNLKKNLFKKINYNQQRLDRLNSKLKYLEEIKKTGNVRLCFGSNKLFRQQFEVNKTNNLTEFKNHNAWYKEWFYQRNKEFTLIGSKDETAGNNNAQISHIKDNLFNLKLNINHKADKITDKYVNITFTLNHEVNTLKQIIVNNNGKNKELWQALTYKLTKQRTKHHINKYVVNISFEKNLIKHTYTSKNNGCIGVDINQDHLAVVNLDNKGNLLNIYTFDYDLNGSKNQNNNSISLAVKDLMTLAVKLNKPIVIEELDFSNKKKTLKSVNNKYIKSKNKQLSSFAYSKIIGLIKARAEDNYIDVREVNPSYTSIIGSIKYSNRSRIDVHHGAAMCIGRKGLFNGYNEDKKLIKEYKEKRISSRNRQIKSTNLPERNNLNSVVYWKELKENMIKSKQHENKSSIKTASRSTSLRYNDVPVMNVSIGTLS